MTGARIEQLKTRANEYARSRSQSAKRPTGNSFKNTPDVLHAKKVLRWRQYRQELAPFECPASVFLFFSVFSWTCVCVLAKPPKQTKSHTRSYLFEKPIKILYYCSFVAFSKLCSSLTIPISNDTRSKNDITLMT